MQNCTRGRFALESRCGRIECLFQTTKNPGQNQSAPKTVPEFATHWHSSVPSPNCMLHLQFWDGALLPPAVLGWHLLTCKFLHLLTCKFFTCSIGMAPSHLQIFSPADLAWHLPGCHNAPKNKNDQAKIQIQTEISETTMKSASAQTKISFSIQNIQTLLKNHEMV